MANTLQNDCASPRLLSRDQNEVRQTLNHSMELETIKKAMMTPPLIFLLLCTKSRLFLTKRIAQIPYFHKPKEREITQLADSH